MRMKAFALVPYISILFLAGRLQPGCIDGGRQISAPLHLNTVWGSGIFPGLVEGLVEI